MAQNYADYLARTNSVQHSQNNRKGYGENIAWTSYAKNKNDAVREAVRNWYSEEKYYNYSRSRSETFSPPSEQLSTAEMDQNSYYA